VRIVIPHVTFVLCEWHLSELTYRCLLATFMAAFRCSPKVQFALAVWGNLRSWFIYATRRWGMRWPAGSSGGNQFRWLIRLHVFAPLACCNASGLGVRRPVACYFVAHAHFSLCERSTTKVCVSSAS